VGQSWEGRTPPKKKDLARGIKEGAGEGSAEGLGSFWCVLEKKECPPCRQNWRYKTISTLRAGKVRWGKSSNMRIN